MRYIEIKTCADCPHLKRGGGFAQIAHKPRCSAMGHELPYNVQRSGNSVIAVLTDIIPPTCPLKEL